MAAPTVGAIMEDILPYLGVERTFSEEDAAGKTLIMEDLTGITVEQAQQQLKKSGLTAKIQGTGETVTAQIPGAGQSLPGGSEVLLYLDGQPEEILVTVPDFTGLNRQQASDLAGSLGLYILVSGNDSVAANVVATEQSFPPDTQVPVGTTIRLTFTDTQAKD